MGRGGPRRHPGKALSPRPRNAPDPHPAGTRFYHKPAIPAKIRPAVLRHGPQAPGLVLPSNPGHKGVQGDRPGAEGKEGQIIEVGTIHEGPLRSVKMVLNKGALTVLTCPPEEGRIVIAEFHY